VKHAILIDLTPVSGAVAGLFQVDIKEKPTGRVDATIVLSAGHEAPSGSDIDAALRPFFHKFDYDFAGWCRPTEAADHHAAWDEIVQFSRQFHGQPLTAESRAKLRSNKAFQDPDEKRLDRAFEKKVNCFIAPGISVEWSYDTLGKTEGDQIRTVSDTLNNLARLLYKFSSLSEPAPNSV
jgi:hypothetical protein